MPKIIRKKLWAGVFLSAVSMAASATRLRRDMREASTYLSQFEPPAVGPYHFGDTNAPSLNLLVVGDSTSVGVGCSLEDSLPWRASTELAKDYHISMTLRGRSGDRSEHIVAQLRASANDVADVVLVCVGSNDAIHMVKFKLSPGEVERNFREIVQQCRAQWPGVAVIFTGAADLGSLAFLGRTLAGRGLRMALDRCARQVNAKVEQVAGELAETYVPLAKLVTQEFRSNPACFSADGFHPGSYGYAVLTDAIMPDLRQVALNLQRPA